MNRVIISQKTVNIYGVRYQRMLLPRHSSKDSSRVTTSSRFQLRMQTKSAAGVHICGERILDVEQFVLEES